jgi:O-methyltransferase / aklanonic acid methyltransferase
MDATSFAANFKSRVTDVFNDAAPRYDRGVEFFTLMGARLVELVAPRVGGRVLDVGCGRGACLSPAATAVGAAGQVVGIDIAPAMIDEAWRETERLGLGNVELMVMDAEDDPPFAPGSFDYVIGSYSIIFLPDPFAALTRFGKLLAPGGRLAFTGPVFSYDTFPFPPEPFGQIITDDFLQHIEEERQPHRIVERYYSWPAGREMLSATLAAAGFDNVVIIDEPVQMVSGSGHDWVAWSRTQGMRLLWNNLPEQPRRELEKSIITELDSRRAADGLITVETPVRYILADVASHRHTRAGQAR